MYCSECKLNIICKLYQFKQDTMSIATIKIEDCTFCNQKFPGKLDSYETSVKTVNSDVLDSIFGITKTSDSSKEIIATEDGEFCPCCGNRMTTNFVLCEECKTYVCEECIYDAIKVDGTSQFLCEKCFERR